MLSVTKALEGRAVADPPRLAVVFIQDVRFASRRARRGVAGSSPPRAPTVTVHGRELPAYVGDGVAGRRDRGLEDDRWRTSGRYCWLWSPTGGAAGLRRDRLRRGATSTWSETEDPDVVQAGVGELGLCPEPDAVPVESPPCRCCPIGWTATPRTTRARRASLLELLAEHDRQLALANARRRREVRRAAPVARQAAGPRADRAAARPGLAVPRALAVGRLGDGLHGRRERRDRDRRGRGHRGHDRRERPDGARRSGQPVHRAAAGPGRRRSPRRTGCRW